MSSPVSKLSAKRIFISLLIIILIPISAHYLDMLTQIHDISLMCSMNIGISLLIMYDWNLFGIHYNRAKANLFDTLLFTLIGCAGISAVFWISEHFLMASPVLPDPKVMRAYGYARPGMWAAFSFMQAVLVNMGFKVMTDPLKIKTRELQTILLTGLLFPLLFTALFTPFDIVLIARTYLYNFLLVTLLSYMYNQSHSIMPGILSMTIVYLAVMFISFTA